MNVSASDREYDTDEETNKLLDSNNGANRNVKTEVYYDNNNDEVDVGGGVGNGNGNGKKEEKATSSTQTQSNAAGDETAVEESSHNNDKINVRAKHFLS